MTGHVFISYAWADEEYAKKLETDLQEAGFTTWRDKRNLDEYQDFSVEIELAIREADYLVTCITPTVEMSPRSFVRREIVYADAKGKPIIPCIFPDATPITLISHLTWIPFFQGKSPKQTLDYTGGLKLLLERLQKPRKAAPPRPTKDPYAEYLKALYEQIVEYLKQTVFALSTSLVELRSEAQPDAVQTVQKQALPLAFFGQAGIETPQTEHKQFASFHEAFDFYNGRVLLLGDPGAGKTTTLLSFVRDAVWKRLEDPSLPLPIIAPIATWNAQQQTPLVDWIASIIPLLNRDNLVSLVADGKALLALDGLDELGSKSEESDPRQQFLSLLPINNQVIVSCRIKDYGEIGQKAALKGAITLHALDDEQMRNYIIDQPDLWAALEADDGLRKVARTPLLLSLFAYAFNGLNEDAKKLHSFKGGELRDKIFETYVRRRYEYEARKRALYYSLEDMTAALQRGALRSMDEMKWIRIKDGNILPTSEQHWDDLGSGSFVDSASIDPLLDPGSSAVELVHRMQSIEPLLQQACLLHLLIPVSKGYYRFVHLLLRDYFAFPEALAALKSQRDDERKKAVHALSEMGDVRAVEPIITLLSAPDKDLRRRAVVVLGQLKDNRAIEPLIDLLNDPSRSVRRRAAEILGTVSDDHAVAGLIEALNDTDNTVIVYAAMSLKKIGTPKAIAALEAWRRESSRE